MAAAGCAAIDLPPLVQAVAVEGDLLVAKSGTSSALGNSGLRFSVFQIRSGKQVGQSDVHENAVMSDAMQILPSELGRSGRSFDQMLAAGFKRLHLPDGKIAVPTRSFGDLISQVPEVLAKKGDSILMGDLGGVLHVCDPQTLACKTQPAMVHPPAVAAEELTSGDLILADARSNGIRIDTDGAVQIVPTSSNPEGEPLALLPRFNGRGGVFALRSDGGINDLLARSANPVGDALDLSTGSTASLAQIVAASADGKLIALVDPAAANADPKVSIAEFPWETQKPDPNTPMNSKPRRLASWPLQSNWNRTQPDTVRDFKFQFAEGGLLLAVDTADGTIHRFDAARGIALAPVKWPIPPPAQSAFFIGGQDNTLEAFGVNRKGTELAIAQNGAPLRAVASMAGWLPSSRFSRVSQASLRPAAATCWHLRMAASIAGTDAVHCSLLRARACPLTRWFPSNRKTCRLLRPLTASAISSTSPPGRSV